MITLIRSKFLTTINLFLLIGRFQINCTDLASNVLTWPLLYWLGLYYTDLASSVYCSRMKTVCMLCILWSILLQHSFIKRARKSHIDAVPSGTVKLFKSKFGNCRGFCNRAVGQRALVFLMQTVVNPKPAQFLNVSSSIFQFGQYQTLTCHL